MADFMLDRGTDGSDLPAPESFAEVVAHFSVSKDFDHFACRFGDYVLPRSFYITEKGYIGLAPNNVRVGDTLVIFWGGSTPYIIRQRDDGSTYEFIGEAYTHGLMDGESLKIGNTVRCAIKLL
jgi:hypothetical protein